MRKRPYDHHRKAGNQGDVVKHVALIAALDALLKNFSNKIFKYADTFAGYAHNPLVKGNEWTQGIGKLAGRPELEDKQHTALYLYAKWYLSRPQLLGGMYPGSSLIAYDVCAFRKKKVQMFLWDNCLKCVEDLSKVFHGQDGVTIFHHKAIPNQKEVRLADFLLIDPPDGKKRTWVKVRNFLSWPRQQILIWLPVCANTTTSPPEEDRQSKLCREEARQMGFTATKVRWLKGGHTIGCQLIYRLPPEATQALQAAVTHVATILPNWKIHHYAV